MSRFKVGDEVVRTVDINRELKVGSVGSVSEVHDDVLRLEGLGGWYSENNFELHNANHHEHYDVIIEWAKGAEVQYKAKEGGIMWVTFAGLAPKWLTELMYRVKPEPVKSEREIRIEKLKAELDNLLSEDV